MFPSPSASPAPSPPAYLFLNNVQGGGPGGGGGVGPGGVHGGGQGNLFGGGGGGNGNGANGGGMNGSAGGGNGGGYGRFGSGASGASGPGGSPRTTPATAVGWGGPRGHHVGHGHQQNSSLSSLSGSIGQSSGGNGGAGAGNGSVGQGGPGSAGGFGGAGAPHHPSTIHGPHGMSHLASPSPLNAHALGHLHGNAGASPVSSPSAAHSPHWQQQLKQAEISRQSASPHHHARAAALAARSATNAAITITDPSKLPSIAANGLHHDSPAKKAINGSAKEEEKNDTEGASSSGGPLNASLAKAKAKEGESEEGQSWTKIDMGGLGLKNLTVDVFKYTFLTALFINHNAIASLSPEIVKLRNLTVLDASGNKLSSLPAELGMLTSLKELFLFDNNLSTLPAELGTLYMLDTLGIEGNPLSDNLRSIVQREGTQALISFLRDTCPVPQPPPEREWITIEPDLPPTSEDDKDAPTESFNVLNYNVLAERYATAQMYAYTPSWALAWDYRKEFIMQEIISYGADLVCLQEVEMEQFENFFVPNLSEQDYESVFFPKSRARTMRDDEKRKVDGCAIFYKSSKFQLIEKQIIEYSQTCLQRPDFRSSEDMYNRVMTKDHIAAVALLENRDSGSRLIVCSTHIHWDPAHRDVKLVQVAMMMDELDKVAERFAQFPAKLTVAEGYPPAPKYSNGTKIPMLVCGDFNSVATSGVGEFMSTGKLDPKHEDFMDHVYGSYTSDGLAHRFALKSAYSNIGELPWTNYTPTYVDVIDYIWYTTNSLAVTGLLGEVDKGYASKAVGFPNAHFPSDHICLLSEFRVKPPNQATGPQPRSVDFGPSSRDKDRRRH